MQQGFIQRTPRGRVACGKAYLFMQADWVVKGVMVGLILASLGSWAVILDKLFRFTA
jgi:hypothetical protein